MSKLYDNYLSLKEEDSTKYYLFHNGIFYLFLDKDAKEVAPLLQLKLTAFAIDIVKCGFPQSAMDKYQGLLKENNIPYQIIEVPSKKKLKKNDDIASSSAIIEKLKTINVYQLTPLQALQELVNLKELLHDE